MRKNVIDNSIYMITSDEFYSIARLERSIILSDAIQRAQMDYGKRVEKIGIRYSEETDYLIKELASSNDEDSHISARELAHALFHSIKNGNKDMGENIKIIILNNKEGKSIMELKKIYPYMDKEVFDYIKEYGHHSYETDIDERIEYDKEFFLYEDEKFKEVKLNEKSLKLSN